MFKRLSHQGVIYEDVETTVWINFETEENNDK